MFAGLAALIRLSHGSAKVLPLFVMPTPFAGAPMGAISLAVAMVVLGLAFMIGTVPMFARFLQGTRIEQVAKHPTQAQCCSPETPKYHPLVDSNQTFL